MERRDLLKMIAAATGTAFVSGGAFAWNDIPAVPLSATGFDRNDVILFNDMAEVIIPKTDTPGAKEANVGEFMAVFVADCYNHAERAVFMDGIEDFKNSVMRTYNQPFELLAPEDKLDVISAMNIAANKANQQEGINYINATPGHNAPVPHFFTLFKQLTIFGFFTSEVGAKKVLRYVQVPGRYDGEYEYKEGDPSWAIR